MNGPTKQPREAGGDNLTVSADRFAVTVYHGERFVGSIRVRRWTPTPERRGESLWSSSGRRPGPIVYGVRKFLAARAREPTTRRVLFALASSDPRTLSERRPVGPRPAAAAARSTFLIAEVAEILGISPSDIRARVNDGRLVATEDSAATVISHDEVVRTYLANPAVA